MTVDPSIPLLAIRHAHRSYAGVPALIDAALDLRAGEVHALMGENGAGKSTLIKLIAGVVPADRMVLALRGQPVRIHTPRDAFALGLRFIHQELNVVPQLSVAENIFLGQPYPAWAGAVVRWRSLNRQARNVLAQLGIHHIDPAERMARLSPGDQMLASIARAFAGEDLAAGISGGLIYVMDEPTAALSGQEVHLLFDVIDRLRARGAAVLYVSHRMDEIFRIADRVTIMRDGRVVETLPIQSTTPAHLIHLMTGRTLQQVYPARQTPIGESVRLSVDRLETPRIHGVTVQLKAGEILGVAGLAGAGRTELLRALMGLDRARAGTIELDGTPITTLNPARAWQQGIAYVPEERRSQGLILSRSVGNNVTLPQLRWLSRAGLLLNHPLERRTSERMGVSVRLKAVGPAQTVRELSGGNQQKVVFARALTQPPRLLLLDEPTRGVDVGAKVDLYHLIRQISAQGTSIVMVSSDLPELLGLTDRILILCGGRMTSLVATAGLTEESLLSLCYGDMVREPATNA